MYNRTCRRAAIAAAIAVTAGAIADSAHARVSILNLTNQSSGSIHGALFVRGDAQPVGTTINLRPFVRLRHIDGPSNNNHSGNRREQGYNTSGRPLQYDERPAGNFTRNLRFRQVPIVTINNVPYKEFILDINEPGNSSRLSIDQIKIYTSDIGGQTGLENSLGDLRFSIGNSLNENTILLDAALTSSSTAGDMRMYVPMALFSGVAATDFVYLYSHFGGHGGGSRTGGGFEQWSVNTVPAPSALVLLSTAAIAGLGSRRRRG